MITATQLLEAITAASAYKDEVYISPIGDDLTHVIVDGTVNLEDLARELSKIAVQPRRRRRWLV